MQSRFDPKSGNISVEFDLMQLHERFERGKLGEVFEKFLKDEITLGIFERYIIAPTLQLKNGLSTPNAKRLAEKNMTRDNLWLNFQVNVMFSLFKAAWNLWLSKDEDFDNIIISLMNKNFLIRICPPIVDMYKDILNAEETSVKAQKKISSVGQENVSDTWKNMDRNEDSCEEYSSMQSFNEEAESDIQGFLKSLTNLNGLYGNPNKKLN